MPQSPYFAAIDLGSNSFHMLVARIDNGKLEVVDREKDMVQIARGLRQDGSLTDEAQTRALDCLQRFSERLRDIPQEQVRAVGTKTLRSAENSAKFLESAEAALGFPIQIISGFEEARLVYAGLSHSISNDKKSRLVIDIGGGSTEFIIGQDYDPQLLESLSLGCVAFTNTFFFEGNPTKKAMRAAYLAASEEIEEIRKSYLKRSWDLAYGTSGTIKAIAEVLEEHSSIIHHSALKSLYDKIASDEELNFNLPKLRREVLPAGIAILLAIFDRLKIEQLHVADATLKDGLIYDTIGRFSDQDSRTTTIERLATRYQIDQEQAKRVEDTALRLWKNIKDKSHNLHGASRTKILLWAATLHEIGLSISHSGYHHHGHYILRHSDLAGFGRYEQVLLAILIRCHRKKIDRELLAELDVRSQQAVIPLIVCLRLATQFNRCRDDSNVDIILSYKEDAFCLTIPNIWLEENPLTAANLSKEADLLNTAGIALEIRAE